MSRITIAALLKLELPGHTARIVDGGKLTFDGEEYRARDSVLGVPTGFDPLPEGVGAEAPAGTISFLPPKGVASSVLNDPANSGARLRLWVTEVDGTTGLPDGEPEQLADWILDTSTILLRETRALELAFVSAGERLFQVNRGNALSPGFHRSVHPGEAGLDNASGVPTSVPWGAPSAPRGLAGYGGGFGGSGGGGGLLEQSVRYL